ncbi:MAG: pyridoxamine 5'-phosphate oxidase family protein [Dehalococcoidia bacterium]|nr:pyridoxamine 5'-phosphate oxidase family protein [Dehalococcoidia bacterium]
MSDASELRRVLKDVVVAQKFCVLATQGHGQPYGSLVAFAATDDLRQLVFATRRDTRKFANLIAEPRVALVIDSRPISDDDVRNAVAVTALGRTHETAGDEKERLAGVYLGKHPGLAQFIAAQAMALCAVEVEDYVIARFDQVARLQP